MKKEGIESRGIYVPNFKGKEFETQKGNMNHSN